MAKFVLIATGGVRPGQDAEYDEWYDKIHIPDICSIPGVISGRRFSCIPATPATPPNVGIYEIESDDPAAVLAEIGRRVQSGEFVISPALDPTGSGMTIYEQKG